MKNPGLWNKDDLHQHLRHALNLELWTIPLYLTALYSIEGLTKLKPKEYPDAAKLIYSVTIQEMLHLELVCNISNALGWRPRFVAPTYNEVKGIPYIHPSKDYLPEILQGYTVKPQALNEQSLRLFCAIELPHPKKEIQFEKERTYHSIADLYEALKLGILALWNTCYVGDEHNTRQKNIFNEYQNKHGRHHGFSQSVYSPETAMKAIDAIIDQGEGADSKKVPADFRPPKATEGAHFDAGGYKGHLSHYQKFRILLHHCHKLPPIYLESINPEQITAQHNMEKAFADLLKELENNFNADGPEMSASFWNTMFTFRSAVASVWESGKCPEFN